MASKKPPLTHFLCLPLITEDSRPKLEKALEAFKEDVCLGHSNDTDHQALIHPKAIRPVGTLHFTLGVMSLKEDQLSRAIDHLKKLDLVSLINSGDPDAALSPTSTTLSTGLRGLESMHAPEKTSILYVAPSDAQNRLHPFCLALQKTFKEEGFLIEDDRELKLHATVVNTIYAKGRKKPPSKAVTILSNGQVVSQTSNEPSEDRSAGHGPNANAPLKFDARKILEQYCDHTWVDSVRLDRIAICEMGAKEITNNEGEIVDERYTEVASVGLPA
ncbi:Putative protein kinase A anchor protein, nuclear localization signal [Septoria linicola]|uniref:A-kinase anchor protein 7-like phosphoesterase domain-containing protein n=1 Tax=Septoria linicola TaxID=215465 RepID=A0A9Q9EFY2_9PEZI|nr:putative protein kinase A anchor protein, nuclear localization signal [Septoria linicola]USW47733.1 Putative protein kinase A anchor protein, nuclear localization signal [Septoria linicola]